MTDKRVCEFWQNYLDTLPPDERSLKMPDAWGFGDNPTMADTLGNLVKQGIKTATCSALWEYEADGDPLPTVGELNIILNGEGAPLCITKVTEVTIQNYGEVDSSFAYAEGEGDRSLRYWREVHERFFTRCLPRIGREFESTMPLVCERFRVAF